MIDLKTAKPREIEGYLREVIRKTFGDEVENAASVYASHGYYGVNVKRDGRVIAFANFRRDEVKKIARAIRAMK